MCLSIPKHPAFTSDFNDTLVYKYYRLVDDDSGIVTLKPFHNYTPKSFQLKKNLVLVSNRLNRWPTNQEILDSRINKGFHTFISKGAAMSAARSESVGCNDTLVVVEFKAWSMEFVAKNDAEMVFTELTINNVVKVYSNGKAVSVAPYKKSLNTNETYYGHEVKV